MKALIQRVLNAEVHIRESGVKRSIKKGLTIFLGVGKGDNPENAAKLADKIAKLRIFSNEQGKFDRSLIDIGGEALVISQFTLYGDAERGRRPDFTQAAAPADAKPLYQEFIRQLKTAGVSKIEEGEFQASMLVNLTNDGPVTLMIEV